MFDSYISTHFKTSQILVIEWISSHNCIITASENTQLKKNKAKRKRKWNKSAQKHEVGHQVVMIWKLKDLVWNLLRAWLK